MRCQSLTKHGRVEAGPAGDSIQQRLFTDFLTYTLERGQALQPAAAIIAAAVVVLINDHLPQFDSLTPDSFHGAIQELGHFLVRKQVEHSKFGLAPILCDVRRLERRDS